MKAKIAVLLLILLLFLAACTQEVEEKEEVEEIKVVEEIEIKEEEKANTYQGVTPALTETFQLESGLALFNIQGKDILEVELLDDQDRFIATLTQAMPGTFAAEIKKSGNYRFSVKQGKDWNIEVIDHTNIPSQAYPVTFTGTGPVATNFFTIEEGFYKVLSTHEGEKEFVVKVLNTIGSLVTTPANIIGSGSAEKSLVVKESGLYLLVVREADGAWEVKIT